MKTFKEFMSLFEDAGAGAPTNATGTAVAGTGDDPVHWKKMPYRVGNVGDRKKKGRYINGVAYLKAAAKAKKERESGRRKT